MPGGHVRPQLLKEMRRVAWQAKCLQSAEIRASPVKRSSVRMHRARRCAFSRQLDRRWIHLGLGHPKRFDGCCQRIGEEDRVNFLYDVSGNFQEVSLVLDRDQSALRAVVHRYLKRFRQTPHSLESWLYARWARPTTAA